MAIEALGMSLANSSAQEAVSASKREDCRRAAAAVVHLIREDIKPLDIMTRKAFENAISVVIALGGSTNAVLHLIAIAKEAGVNLGLDDFTRIGANVPVLADLVLRDVLDLRAIELTAASVLATGIILLGVAPQSALQLMSASIRQLSANFAGL